MICDRSIHRVTKYVLSATFRVMERQAQCCLGLNGDYIRTSRDIITFQGKQSEYAEKIFVISLILLVMNKNKCSD